MSLNYPKTPVLVRGKMSPVKPNSGAEKPEYHFSRQLTWALPVLSWTVLRCCLYHFSLPGIALP